MRVFNFTNKMKICSICKELKEISLFQKRSDRVNKFRPECKKCAYDYRKKYLSEHKNGWNYKRDRDNGLYKKYLLIQTRCNNKKAHNARSYYLKGIKVEWKSYEDFKIDMQDSYDKHVLEFGRRETTIDRIQNDKNYCKSNCRWATFKEQAQNKTLSKKIKRI